MSHYVVTGGAGFIGSAIVRSLLREGAAKVVVIDNLLTGHERNLEEIRGSVDFQHADICSYEEIARITSLPMGTVKNRIFRAREILKCQLSDWLVAEADA